MFHPDMTSTTDWVLYGSTNQIIFFPGLFRQSDMLCGHRLGLLLMIWLLEFHPGMIFMVDWDD